MILGDRGEGGYQYQLVNRYEMMEIPRHLEPSFFDGARRGKPRLYSKSGVSPQTVKPCSSRSAGTFWHVWHVLLIAPPQTLC